MSCTWRASRWTTLIKTCNMELLALSFWYNRALRRGGRLWEKRERQFGDLSCIGINSFESIQGALYIVIIVTKPDCSGCSSAVTNPGFFWSMISFYTSLQFCQVHLCIHSDKPRFLRLLFSSDKPWYFWPMVSMSSPLLYYFDRFICVFIVLNPDGSGC